MLHIEIKVDRGVLALLIIAILALLAAHRRPSSPQRSKVASVPGKRDTSAFRPARDAEPAQPIASAARLTREPHVKRSTSEAFVRRKADLDARLRNAVLDGAERGRIAVDGFYRKAAGND